MRFFFLEKKNKVKEGKQKYNLFADRPVGTANNLIFNDNRIAKTNRQIDRSLRSVVMNNRKRMKPLTTAEEKDLQLLAQGQ